MEEMEMELTPEQAVKNGAEWLDKVYPEWWSRVDLGVLNIDSGFTCICGQLFHSKNCITGFRNVDNIIQIALEFDSGSATEWMYDHGFLLDDPIGNPLWVTEIKRRADIGLVD